MAYKLISSMQELAKALRKYSKEKPDIRIFEAYFKGGGIIKLDILDDEARLIYPTKAKLKQMIREKLNIKKELEGRKKEWQKKYNAAKNYYSIHNIKKFSSPLYWKHLMKYVGDRNYREQADKVKLPVNLISDERWKPMVKTFIENEDYRNQLTETVENSVIYKNKKEVAVYAKKLQEFRQENSLRNIKAFDDKIERINHTLNALHELLNWNVK